MNEANLSERAYRLLRSELLSCRIEPGLKINIVQASNAFGLNQAAVREALSRLAAEGLAQMEPNRGFVATSISELDFLELSAALLQVELPCLRAAVENGGRDWELELVSIYHRAARVLELVVAGKEDISAYWTERLAFYETLLSACDNRYTLWAWKLLYSQNIRYRQIYMPLAHFEFELTSLHEAIMKAIFARDADTVIELSTQYYARVNGFIEEAIRASSTIRKARQEKVPKPKAGKRSKAA